MRFDQDGGGLHGSSSNTILLSHTNVVGNVALVRQLIILCERYNVRVGYSMMTLNERARLMQCLFLSLGSRRWHSSWSSWCFVRECIVYRLQSNWIRKANAEALPGEDDWLELLFSISRTDRMHVKPSLLWSIRQSLRRKGSVLHVQDAYNV